VGKNQDQKSFKGHVLKGKSVAVRGEQMRMQNETSWGILTKMSHSIKDVFPAKGKKGVLQEGEFCSGTTDGGTFYNDIGGHTASKNRKHMRVGVSGHRRGNYLGAAKQKPLEIRKQQNSNSFPSEFCSKGKGAGAQTMVDRKMCEKKVPFGGGGGWRSTGRRARTTEKKKPWEALSAGTGLSGKTKLGKKFPC